MDFQIVEMCSYDYLVIDCGYVNRLIRRTADMISCTTVDKDEETKGHALMFFIDGEAVVDVQADHDDVVGTLLGLVKEKKLSTLSAVCFKQEDHDVDVLEMLVRYHHCGGFSTDPYKVASFKTKNGKRILYKEFDTESG